MVRRFLYLFIFLLLLTLGIGVSSKFYLDAPLNVKKSTLFTVTPGSSIEMVGQKLEQAGYLNYPLFLDAFARLTGDNKKLKAGEYLVEPGMSPRNLLQKIVSGKVFLRRYTIVEGWNLKQVFQTINTNPYLKHTINQITPEKLANAIGAQKIQLEGFFNPDTYLFAAGVPDIVILKRAYQGMQKNLNNAWCKRATNLPYKNSYEALIVASLIEKETAQNAERPKIAGVILRRLELGMRLQIDASVIYGLGNSYSKELTKDNLHHDTPYNTYLHDGLPPTPIAMPSLASINAALHPASGTDLYYVARGDGSHQFSATLENHISAIRKYRSPAIDFFAPAINQDNELSVMSKEKNWEAVLYEQELHKLQADLNNAKIIAPKKINSINSIKKPISKKLIVTSTKHKEKPNDQKKRSIHHH